MECTGYRLLKKDMKDLKKLIRSLPSFKYITNPIEIEDCYLLNFEINIEDYNVFSEWYYTDNVTKPEILIENPEPFYERILRKFGIIL